MTTKRRSKRIKRRTVKRGRRPPRPVIKHGGDGSLNDHIVNYVKEFHASEPDQTNLRGGKRRSRKYKLRKKKKTRRRRKHHVGKGIGKSKPIQSPTPPKQTRKSVQFSPSTKSPSSPKNKTKKMFISKNKHKQKAVVQYYNRQQQQDLLDMSLGRIPLNGGKRVRRGKKSKRR